MLLAVSAASISCSEIDALLRELKARTAARFPANAGKALKKLEVSPPGSMAGYDREDFPTGPTRRSSGGTCRIAPATSGKRP
jgi:hypothetical protein